MRLAGVLASTDGVITRSSEQHQPAAPREPLYAPADAKSSLSDLVYLGIVLSRFWKDDHSNLMRCVNRHRNLTRLPLRSMVAIWAGPNRTERHIWDLPGRANLSIPL